MPIPSSIPGWDIVDYHETMEIHDRYTGGSIRGLTRRDVDFLDEIAKEWAGRSWKTVHAVPGYTVIRKNNNWKAMPRRLALSRVGSIELPLP